MQIFSSAASVSEIICLTVKVYMTSLNDVMQINDEFDAKTSEIKNVVELKTDKSFLL